MAGKPKQMSKIKQLLRMHKMGTAKKRIARNLHMSKTTVKAYLSKYESSKLSIDTLISMDDHILERIFHPGNPAYKDDRFDDLKDNLDHYVNELKRVGVNKKLLWEEYRMVHPEGYSLSQFYYHLSQHILAKNPSMVLNHQPGEKLYVDFAGKKLSYIDIQTGEIIECQVFVACLPYSDFSFCIAVKSQCIEDFIYALTKCLQSIGGAPKVLVSDNLKSAIVKANTYEPTVNQTLEDFGNHYNMVVIPTRAGKPKDKALVENQVKLIYNRVYAKIRNQQFFSLEDLNRAITKYTAAHNQTRMQQKEYCREEHFLSKENPMLQLLPSEPFEIKYYKEYKLAQNNHIYLTQDKHYYSAPYQYIGKKIKVVYTRSIVKLYCDQQLIAVHRRNYSVGRYTTDEKHLCSTHQHYLKRSPNYYKNKAKEIGEALYSLINLVFKQNRYPEQLYKTCDGIFSLCRTTDQDIFDKACCMAIEHKNYTYTFLKNIIQNRMTDYYQKAPEKPLPSHQNIRGKQYYSNQLTFKL